MKRLNRVVLASVGIVTTAALAAAVLTLSSTTNPETTSTTTVPASANVTGVAAATEAPSASKVAAASAAPATATVHTVYVSATNVTASTADDVNGGMTAASAATLVAAINDYWSKESNGLVTVKFGGFETRAMGAASCNASTVFANAPTAAFNGRFKNSAWSGSFDHLLVLTAESCASAGLGSVGGDGGIMLSGNGISGGTSTPVAAHEFGHNLGFGHAGSSVCATAEQDAPVSSFGGDSSTCPTVEYADYLDIMGYSFSGALPHLSSPQRIRSGWMTDYTALSSANGSTTTTITSLDGATGNRAIRITDPNTGANYYVEFRTASGTDATSTEFTATETCFTTAGYSNCSRGASASTGSVRILKELPYRDYTQYVRTTVLAAGSTESGSTTRSTRFSAGDTFTSTGGGFYLSVNSVNAASGASITVRFTPPVTTTSILTLSRATQTHGSTPATATLAVSGNATGTVTYLDGKKVIATAPVSGGTASISLPSTLKAGKHTVTAMFTPSTGDFVASTAAAKVLTVKKATSTAKITKLKKSKKTVKATVKITVSGVKNPTGTVSIYANGKKLKSYKLTAKQAGVVSVKVTIKASSKKAMKFTAKYSGTTNVLAKTSAARKA